MTRLFFVLILALVINKGWTQPSFDKEGHRGCRGLMPENTIQAMKKAGDLGVTTLELDVVISKDKQVVVSHEPFMSSAIATNPDGKAISSSDEKSYNLYQMPYSEIRKFDVGSKVHPKFPQQAKFAAYKPLLDELIDSVEAYLAEKQLPALVYNIEIKSTEKGDRTFHPEPDEFVEIVMQLLKRKNLGERIIIQSFDVRPLQLIRKKYPDVKVSFLIANVKSAEANLKALGFKPDIYSPYYKTVTKNNIAYCHNEGIKIVPWTVNSRKQIDKLISMGVDGIITDYPNLF